MDPYTWIVENRELFKIVYSVIIVLICAGIVFRADRLFHLSLHQGIRYFRNAFLFYGLAFIIRYFLGPAFLSEDLLSNYFYLINILFEFFLIMGGFFLLYSLLWKKIDPLIGAYSSLVNLRIFVFYLMAVLLVILDYLWATHCFLFFSQIVVFLLASGISYANYRKKDRKYKFSKFYFIAMLLGLLAWILNAVAELYFNWNQGILINIYILNLIFFLLFLFGVFRITKSAK